MIIKNAVTIQMEFCQTTEITGCVNVGLIYECVNFVLEDEMRDFFEVGETYELLSGWICTGNKLFILKQCMEGTVTGKQ